MLYVAPTHVAVTHRRYLVENADMHVLQTAKWEGTCAFIQNCLPDILIYDLACCSLNPNMLLVGFRFEVSMMKDIILPIKFIYNI